MLELIQKIKDYTEAGIILNHMELFDELYIKNKHKRRIIHKAERKILYLERKTESLIRDAKAFKRYIDKKIKALEDAIHI